MNDRNQPTAADTWDEEPITRDRLDELLDVLEAHPKYTVRPAVQVSHDDSALVETIETLPNAEETLSNLRAAVMFEEEPFAELTPEQVELLAGHEFAEDSRKAVHEYAQQSDTKSDPPGEGTDTRAVLEAFEPSEVMTCDDLSHNVPDSIAYDGHAGSVASFLATLCDRGFVERTESSGKPQRYRLTERGEDVL